MADVLTQIPQFGFNVPMPMDPDLTPEAINSGLSWMTRQRKQALDDAEAAIRWQGQQDFDRYFKEAKDEGLDDISASTRAFVKAGPKLFRNDPNTLISLIRATQPKPKPEIAKPEVVDYGGKRFVQTVNPNTGSVALHALDTALKPKSTTAVYQTQEYKDLSEDVDRAAKAYAKAQEDGADEDTINKVKSDYDALRAQRMAMVRTTGATPEIPQYQPETTPAAVGVPSQLFPPNIAPEKATAPQGKAITRELALQFLKDAKGDKERARQIARDAGYTF